MTEEKRKLRIVKLQQIGSLKRKICVLKQNLSRTDYQALKFSDGALTEEEYAPMRAQRQAWRDEINAAEEEIRALQFEMEVQS